jgi:hypothetical protein
MQHPVDRLPRNLLLRNPVNKDEKEGRSPQRNPWPSSHWASAVPKPPKTISLRLELLLGYPQ